MVARQISIKIPCSVNAQVDNFQLSLEPSQISSFTVLDLKQKLGVEHPCKPAIDDQRLVWRGRLLGNQESISILFDGLTSVRLKKGNTLIR